MEAGILRERALPGGCARSLVYPGAVRARAAASQKQQQKIREFASATGQSVALSSRALQLYVECPCEGGCHAVVV